MLFQRLVSFLAFLTPCTLLAMIPLESLPIPSGEFQAFVDDYLVENRYDEKMLVTVRHHVHQGRQEPANPLIVADQPWETADLIGPASVIYDSQAKLFRAWYVIYDTAHVKTDRELPNRVGYAESKDGISWTKPLFDLYPWDGEKSNVVFQHGKKGATMFQLVDIPEEKRGGHRFLGFFVGDDGSYLAGSPDGINWKALNKILPTKSDCQHSVTYDAQRDEFVIYYRNLAHFQQIKDHPRSGVTRVVSRIANKELFTLWEGIPRAVLIPDGKDAVLFYGMTVSIRHQIYYGFLEHFDLYPNSTLDSELTTSRDGLTWKRYDREVYAMKRGRYARKEDKELLITRGPYGEWNGGMVKPSISLIDYNGEWLLYYTGFGGYHTLEDAFTKKSALGLLRFRKEGLVSLRSHPSLKSYVVTRPLIWPGGTLKVNFDGSDVFEERGSLRVRVVNVDRSPIEGFSYDDCERFEGDDVRAPIRWANADLNQLKGREIRLEFEFKRGDLFGFVAEP